MDSEWELHVSTLLSDFSGIRGLVSLLSRSSLFALLASLGALGIGKLSAVVDSERMLESVSLRKAKKTRQAQKGEEKPRRPLLLMHPLPLNLLLSLTYEQAVQGLTLVPYL